MRYEPDLRFYYSPCSVVGTATAYEHLTGKLFPMGSMPQGLKPDGYLPLADEDKYIREFLRVKKKKYFRRNERQTLVVFLREYKGAAAVCVLGHFVFVDNGDYWSFFDNDNDMVVCVWYL